MPPETAVLHLLGGHDSGESADWVAMAAIAQEHRLEPLLAEMAPRSCPPDIAARWQDAARHSALAALAHRRAMLHLAHRLSGYDKPPLFLKGAWFAHHAYARPALRPLRDLDILLPEDAAVAAWNALQGDGFTADPGPGANALRRSFHHLPPLTHPEWGRVEIHMRLWSPATRVPGLPREPDDPWAGHRVDSDGIASPSPLVMLAHLAVHTMHSGAMDAGPLALTDCDRLCAVANFDWEEVWRKAADSGWLPAAALLLTLTDQYVRPGLLLTSRCPLEPPVALVDAAPLLLCQPLARRDRMVMLGAMRDPGLAQARAVGGKRDWGLPATARRAARFAGALVDRESRRRAEAAVALDRWLKG